MLTPIESGARTVAHIAPQLEGLQARAHQLREQFGARERGYFTPTEDEQLQQLLITYWHSRNALFEVIHRFRPEIEYGEGPESDSTDAFLVAYGAAVLLVDSARFVRDEFKRVPVVVTKLNQAEPTSGIPAGVFDTIQASLTSPGHAWHLHQANEYWSRHVGTFRARVTNDPILAPVLEVIERLGERVRVRPADYARARVSDQSDLLKRAGGHRLGKAHYWILKLASRLVSNLMVRPHDPSLPPTVRDRIGTLLRPGDVFVTRKEYAATNYFLPGFWPHAALYLGSPTCLERLGLAEHENVKPRWERLLSIDPIEPRRVLEAMGDGVRLRSVSSPLAVDAVAVIRPRLRESEVSVALGRGLLHEGKPYDFDFDFTRADRMVCTEVVYRTYEGIGGLSFPLTRRVGRMTLAAEDLLRMSIADRGFETVAVFVPHHGDDLVVGPKADEVLTQTMNR